MPWTEGEVIANGYGAFWWEGVIDENVLKLTEVIVVQFFEYIKKKTHWTVYLKSVSYMVCGLYLNKAVIFFKEQIR